MRFSRDKNPVPGVLVTLETIYTSVERMDDKLTGISVHITSMEDKLKLIDELDSRIRKLEEGMSKIMVIYGIAVAGIGTLLTVAFDILKG